MGIALPSPQSVLMWVLSVGIGAASAPAPQNFPDDFRLPPVPEHRDAVSGKDDMFRLRKLHLVRPDLISYPIPYEYYCAAEPRIPDAAS